MARVTAAIETREGLSVVDFGRVSAVLRHFGSRRAPELLARLGLSADRWAAAEAAWTRAIDDDAESAEGARLNAWNDAFEATRKDLDARKPDVDGIEPLMLAPAPAALAPALPPPLGVPPPLVNAPPGDAPSPWAGPSEARKRAPTVTQILDVKPMPAAAALPFKEPEPTSEPREQRSSVKRAPVFTDTVDIDERKLLQAILPFGLSAPPAGAPSLAPLRALSPSPAPAGPYVALTLEQYASFVAELATFPARAGEIRAKYFVISEMLIAALHASWHERLRDDPALMERFQALYARYRAWLVESHRERS